ncbi:MAG TPA: hypothetical protein VF495_03750 [Phenylobacterium sp.]
MLYRTRLHQRGLQAAVAAAAALTCSQADAQSYVRADCRPLVSAARLDPSPLTARWYKRFWTGDCGGLRGCLDGSPNWNEVVGKLVARSAPAQRPAVLARACRLGPLIGQEWTRPRKVRRIDSGDLRGFKTALESGGEVLEGIARVEAQARAKIGRDRG